VCLVTFNYDRMLEEALPTVGIEIRELSDYIASDNYKVIKPHGSVDWGREVETPVTVSNRNAWEIADELIDRAPELVISQRYQRVNQRPIGLYGQSVFFPALAIPVEKKTEYECPADHLETLRNFIPRATKLLVVGWHATEYRFLKLLAKDLPIKVQIMIVSGSRDGATDVSKRLDDSFIRTQVQSLTYEQGFTHFVQNRAGDEFLRA